MPTHASHDADPRWLRNVALVGHPGAGTTTLVGALAQAAGATARPYAGLSAVTVEHAGHRVTLLDTPGHPESVAGLRGGLRAADAVVFVISAAQGFGPELTLLWQECDAAGIPRALAVTHLDDERADFEEIVVICQQVLSADNPAATAALFLPMAAEDGTVAGLMDLVAERVVDYSSGARTLAEPDQEHRPLIANQRDAVVEAVLAESDDETLLDGYLAGDVDVDALRSGVAATIRAGGFHPVLPVAATEDVGLVELLDLIVDAFPSPLDRESPAVATPDGSPRMPLTADPDGLLAAEVVGATPGGPLVRVHSGTLRVGEEVHVAGHRRSAPAAAGQRVVTLHRPDAGGDVATAVAGDVCQVGGLDDVRTADTLSSPTDPLLLEPWLLPEPHLPVEVSAPGGPALADALGRLVARDPTLRLTVSDTGVPVLWTLGDHHLAGALDALGRDHGITATTRMLQSALRVTVAAPTTVALAGGWVLAVSPSPRGGGLSVEGPRVVAPTMLEALAAGFGDGVPAIDVQATLTHLDPASSPPDREALAGALAETAAVAGTTLLEPVDHVEVIVADEYAPAVLSDLGRRRAAGKASEPAGGGRSRVTATVPARELTRYAVDLASLAHGTAALTRTHTRYAPVPPSVAARLRAAGAR